MTSSIDLERERQQRLLAALSAGTAIRAIGGDARLAEPSQHGLAAYRANAHAVAARALAAAFPTVAAMLGEAKLAAAARDHWRDAPPARGDLGEWGAELPAWLDAQPALAEWPWLADVARLDWAVHLCERAADATFDAASLQALADTDPARLRLQWRPGCAFIESRWPIATLHAAHLHGAADDAIAGARGALAAGTGEAVWVARDGWRARVNRVAEGELPWWRAVAAERDLASALAAAGEGFDFTAWLGQALASGGLKGIERIAD